MVHYEGIVAKFKASKDPRFHCMKVIVDSMRKHILFGMGYYAVECRGTTLQTLKKLNLNVPSSINLGRDYSYEIRIKFCWPSFHR